MTIFEMVLFKLCIKHCELVIQMFDEVFNRNPELQRVQIPVKSLQV